MLHSKTERFAVPSSSEFADDAEMFELAPVSLWLEDYSGLKALFERWRAEGVISLRDYLMRGCGARRGLLRARSVSSR